jgi:hypothetical protein
MLLMRPEEANNKVVTANRATRGARMIAHRLMSRPKFKPEAGNRFV